MPERASLAAVFLALTISCGSSDGGAPRESLPEVAIRVDGEGYHPSEARAPGGQRVRLVFTRTSDEGCGQQLVFPDLDIRRDLPLDEAVPVEVTMPAAGSIRFTCGMDMYQGSVLAQ
ncbi:MAG: cupredoxin domain-containing protein [Sandaracinaceae bacterium]|nr:cupredoxin domain-containing protein [Sandaracinaceae bacterium]